MALDEPTIADRTFEVEGVKWMVSREAEPMIDLEQGVRVDHVNGPYGSGFYVSKLWGLGGC